MKEWSIPPIYGWYVCESGKYKSIILVSENKIDLEGHKGLLKFYGPISPGEALRMKHILEKSLCVKPSILVWLACLCISFFVLLTLKQITYWKADYKLGLSFIGHNITFKFCDVLGYDADSNQWVPMIMRNNELVKGHYIFPRKFSYIDITNKDPELYRYP